MDTKANKNNPMTNDAPDFADQFNNDVWQRQETDYPSVEMINRTGVMQPDNFENKVQSME